MPWGHELPWKTEAAAPPAAPKKRSSRELLDSDQAESVEAEMRRFKALSADQRLMELGVPDLIAAHGLAKAAAENINQPLPAYEDGLQLVIDETSQMTERAKAIIMADEVLLVAS